MFRMLIESAPVPRERVGMTKESASPTPATVLE
jgi:hypothetical protein